jgi:hypothetical protein
MDWTSTIKTIAPTVATALGGPMAGAAVSAIAKIFGMDDMAATPAKIADAITSAQMTPEQVSKLKELELQYQNEEQERGFKYAELAFKDRESARTANVQGGVQKHLFVLSIILLVLTLGCEILVLFHGYPETVPDIIVGRVLGLMDSVALMVLAYWYGTTNGSQLKTTLMANSGPAR